MELIHAKEKGIELLREAEENRSDKVKNYKIKTFASKQTKNQPKAKQIKRLYKDETAVTRSLYFVHNLDDEAKVETLSHEWTQYPPALFEPNDDIEQGYQMRSGNKAEFVASLKKILGDNWRVKKSAFMVLQKVTVFI